MKSLLRVGDKVKLKINSEPHRTYDGYFTITGIKPWYDDYKYRLAKPGYVTHWYFDTSFIWDGDANDILKRIL